MRFLTRTVATTNMAFQQVILEAGTCGQKGAQPGWDLGRKGNIAATPRSLIRRALLYLGQKVGLGRIGEEQGMSDPDDGVGT